MVIGYELGNIFSIRYDKNNLPDNDQMLADLKDMLFCLNEIKSDLINEKIFQQNIDYILSLDLDFTSSLEKRDIKNIAGKIPEIKLTETNLIAGDSTGRTLNKNGRKSDYDALQKQNSRIGFLGEQIILEYERNRFSDRPDLFQKIEHVSQTKGDGLGYDIASVNNEGKEVFIEVKTTTQGKNASFYLSRNELEFAKTTTQGKNASFYLSRNELEFAKTHPDNYFLYRLYNFSDLVEVNDINFFKINGYQMNDIDLQPVSFMANIKLDS